MKKFMVWIRVIDMFFALVQARMSACNLVYRCLLKLTSSLLMSSHLLSLLSPGEPVVVREFLRKNAKLQVGELIKIPCECMVYKLCACEWVSEWVGASVGAWVRTCVRVC